jgi:predicted transglutaminase-like protease
MMLIFFIIWSIVGSLAAYLVWLLNQQFNLYLDKKYPMTKTWYRKHPENFELVIMGFVGATFGPLLLIFALVFFISQSFFISFM